MQVGESMRSYLTRMGMADGFLPAMLKVPSDRIKLLSRHEMVAFGLIQDEPFGPSRVAMDQGDTECSAQREVVASKQSARKDRQRRAGLHAHAPAKSRSLVSAPTAAACEGRQRGTQANDEPGTPMVRLAGDHRAVALMR
jgi:hypothetical protein